MTCDIPECDNEATWTGERGEWEIDVCDDHKGLLDWAMKIEPDEAQES